MSDITKILAENQKEMLKLIDPTTRKPTILENLDTLILNTKTPEN